jgi:hypothetical protein
MKSLHRLEAGHQPLRCHGRLKGDYQWIVPLDELPCSGRTKQGSPPSARVSMSQHASQQLAVGLAHSPC